MPPCSSDTWDVIVNPKLKAAAWRCTPVKLAQCPGHPVLSPQTLTTSSCVSTLLYTYSFRGKKKGRAREVKRERAREEEGEQRGKESVSRRGTGTEMGRKGRSVRALRASWSSWDLASVLRASYNAGVQFCVRQPQWGHTPYSFRSCF